MKKCVLVTIIASVIISSNYSNSYAKLYGPDLSLWVLQPNGRIYFKKYNVKYGDKEVDPADSLSDEEKYLVKNGRLNANFQVIAFDLYWRVNFTTKMMEEEKKHQVDFGINLGASPTLGQEDATNKWIFSSSLFLQYKKAIRAEIGIAYLRNYADDVYTEQEKSMWTAFFGFVLPLNILEEVTEPVK
jgi:hypothetical protein